METVKILALVFIILFIVLVWFINRQYNKRVSRWEKAQSDVEVGGTAIIHPKPKVVKIKEKLNNNTFIVETTIDIKEIMAYLKTDE